jgi:hypothetical protein
LELTVKISWSKVNNHAHLGVEFLGTVQARFFGQACGYSRDNTAYLIYQYSDSSDTGSAATKVLLGQAYSDSAWGGALEELELYGDWETTDCEMATLTLSTNDGKSISFDKSVCGNCGKPDVKVSVVRGSDGKVTFTVPK